ncbi:MULTISPECIES: HAD family hydrolase [Prochlorococcus]|uniref:Predicted hydrolase, HAD superfamily n=3 Tax=Prochlorococcus marinus TaxID=1219 RepID=Q7VB22_PROMA|nr:MULTISPECIES: haloacid dehalogenase [Prochlorococcus]AAQ00322.1 Predicted hydrolase, HAD superfamily [Prochlorococcus marinus subsp. marinus str. CCMP1375]KGG35491.1 putative hydrolase [Prochlorococcus sp. SS52]
MRIAIDIDNTLVDYRRIVIETIMNIRPDSRDLVSKMKRKDIVDIKKLIKIKYSDEIWQEVQGHIYSHRGDPITFYPYASQAIKRLAEKGLEIYIVSHRSKYGLKSAEKINILRVSQERIFNWIKDSNCSESIKSVIFCDTYQEKIKTLSFISPSTIVDDLYQVHNDHLQNNAEQKNRTFNILFGNSLPSVHKSNKYMELISCNDWKIILELLIDYYGLR